MKKTFSLCFLIISLLVVSQLAIADDPAGCPLLSEIQTLTFNNVEPGHDENTFNVSTPYKENNEGIISYRYMFYVKNVKAIDAADAGEKVKNAISAAAARNLGATSMEKDYDFTYCYYTLNFADVDDEYHGNPPQGIAEITPSGDSVPATTKKNALIKPFQRVLHNVLHHDKSCWYILSILHVVTPLSWVISDCND